MNTGTADMQSNVFRQSVAEADIDWLFCVELNSSSEFRAWVAGTLLPGLADIEHVNA